MGAPRPYSDTRPLIIEEVELGNPGAEEVVVRILAAGVCHSDLSTLNGDRPRPMPMVLGHEAVGEVEKTGAHIGDLKRGDQVCMVFVPSCGSCPMCAVGRPALCGPGGEANTSGSLLGGALRISLDGRKVLHHLGVSAFAERAVVHRRSLVKAEEKLIPEIDAVFGCAVLTGAGAVLNTAQLRPGESVLVVGLGGVGLAALLGARAAGASLLVAADTNPSKAKFAADLGADLFINPAEEGALEKLRGFTKGGVSVAAEFAGSASALGFAMSATRRGGRTVAASLPHPDVRLPVAITALVAEERALLGSYVGSCVPHRDVPAFMTMHRRGRLPVDRLISHHICLADINTAMERLAAGNALRQIVMF